MPHRTPEMRAEDGAQVLLAHVDELRKEVRGLRERLDENTELTKELRRLVYALDKWSEGQTVQSKHSVTWQGLMGATLTMSLAICGVCWKFVERTEMKLEQSKLEMHAQVVAELGAMERKVDDAQRMLVEAQQRPLVKPAGGWK